MSIVRLELRNDPVDPEAIDVWVDGDLGDEPCRFRLDTGSGTCRVRTTDATRRLLSRARRAVSPRVASAWTRTRSCSRCSALAITTSSMFRPPARRSISTRALVGYERPHASPVPVPVRRRRVGTDRSVASSPTGWLRLDLHTAGQPTMVVHFGDLVVNGCWDTGAGLTAVDTGFARVHPELFVPLRSSVGVDASGVEVSSVIATMAACSIGHVEFPESACALVDLSALNEHLRLQSIEEGRHYEPMLFIVGMPLIQLADWDFDFPAATWAVTRAA